MMRTNSLRYYQFGPFRLNATERLLEMSTETVPLTPKVFDTLLVLVENSGHVLGKNELMEKLWPDTFVEESSLTQNISLLRRALGEGDGEQRYIETIPKRGYRFVAEVRELPDPVEELRVPRTTTEIAIAATQIEPAFPASISEAIDTSHTGYHWHRGHTRLLYGSAAVVLAGVLLTVFLLTNGPSKSAGLRSIAILPFKTIGQDQRDAELQGLGIADAIINRLGKLERPLVLPTSSISRYTTRDKDALEIGRGLGVDVVLDGTVQRDGQRVRVTAQLIRLSDGKQVWSAKYDGDYRDTFALQDSIAGQMAPELAAAISSDFKKPLTVRTTDDAEAYKAYLTGIFFWNKRTKENVIKAIGHLEEAVARDPSFALAHAVLADCHYLDVDGNLGILPEKEALARAHSESDGALALDEGLAEAHTVKAGLRLIDNDRVTADKEFRRALELNPNYAVAHLRYGYFLFGEGKIEQALAEMKRAQQLDPVSLVSNTALGFMLFMSGDSDGSIHCFKRAIEVQPDFLPTHFLLIDVYVTQRMFDEALAESKSLRGVDALADDVNRIYVYAASGRRDEATRMLRQISDPGGRVRPYDYAVIYSALDNNDKAFEWLEKTSPTRFNQSLLKFDPRLNSLREDSRFAKYLNRSE